MWWKKAYVRKKNGAHGMTSAWQKMKFSKYLQKLFHGMCAFAFCRCKDTQQSTFACFLIMMEDSGFFFFLLWRGESGTLSNLNDMLCGWSSQWWQRMVFLLPMLFLLKGIHDWQTLVWSSRPRAFLNTIKRQEWEKGYMGKNKF